MNGILQINSQKWTLCGSDGMKLFLPREHRRDCVYFQADWSFLPPGVDAATAPADAKLRLRLIGFVPGLSDWRDLENLFLGYHDHFEGRELDDTRGPDMWIWQPGIPDPLRYGHWETDLHFRERHDREFDFSLEAYCPTNRVSKFKVDYAVKQFFHQPVPAEWELPEWIEEGDQLSFGGRVEFKEIICCVPLNNPRPLEWAKQVSQRELAVEQFGPCSVHDKNHPGKYEVEQNSSTGRLVALQLPVNG